MINKGRRAGLPVQAMSRARIARGISIAVTVIYILLGIVCDNGQGIYLVFPDTTVITQLQNLIEALNHE